MGIYMIWLKVFIALFLSLTHLVIVFTVTMKNFDSYMFLSKYASFIPVVFVLYVLISGTTNWNRKQQYVFPFRWDTWDIILCVLMIGIIPVLMLGNYLWVQMLVP